MKKVLFLGFIFIGIIFAQSKEPALLKSLQNKFSSFNSFSVDFSQETNGKATLSGKLVYKKDNMIRLELKNLIISSDGETTWNFNKKDKKVIVSTYQPEDAAMLSPEKFIFDFPKKSAVSESSENGKRVLIFSALKNDNQFKQAKVILSGEMLPEQIVVTGNDGTLRIFHFTDFKENPPLEKDFFTFKIPQGVKVIDLR